MEINLTAFEKTLLNSFKAFVKSESGLELDFRSHVFLSNQYGAYPSYDYSIAETVVDCIYSFLDEHFIDYTGRMNRSMDIESLRTQKLNVFIVNRLSNEISKELFESVKKTKKESLEFINEK